MNKKYAHVAYIRTAIEIGSMEGLAERTAKNADLEVSKVKTNGFVLRKRSGADLADEDLAKALYKAVCDVLESDIEETTDYISENFDFSFNPDEIKKEQLIELFDVNRDGRLIYIELDL